MEKLKFLMKQMIWDGNEITHNIGWRHGFANDTSSTSHTAEPIIDSVPVQTTVPPPFTVCPRLVLLFAPLRVSSRPPITADFGRHGGGTGWEGRTALEPSPTQTGNGDRSELPRRCGFSVRPLHRQRTRAIIDARLPLDGRTKLWPTMLIENSSAKISYPTCLACSVEEGRWCAANTPLRHSKETTA